MGNLELVYSAISGKDSEGESFDKLGDISGAGSIFGVFAAILGLLLGVPLVPMTAIPWIVTDMTPFAWLFGMRANYNLGIAAFMGLLGMGLLLQTYGSRDMRAKVGSMIGSSFLVAFIMALVVAGYAIVGMGDVTYFAAIAGYLSMLYFLGMIFVIVWQVTSIFYIDTSVTWLGLLAGLCNGLFIPVLALGQALGSVYVYLAYILLLIGQLMSAFYWWSPYSTIREYARSPDKAKFAFGLSGLLTFIIGLAPIYYGAYGQYSHGIQIWRPWSSVIPVAGDDLPTTYVTNPVLVFALLAAMFFWIMLAPRLGAKELKAAAIGEDIIKGGSKYFALFLIILGLIGASQAGTFFEGVGSVGYFIVIGISGAMILIGSMYTATTDVISGLPLIIAGVVTMIHPFLIATIIFVAWIMVIVSQFFIMIESYIRGLTRFSQGALTVIASIISSALLIVFMLGGLGSGPLALWPTNRWFNISFIPNIPISMQASLIILLPFIVLMLRNAALTGYAHGRGYTTGGILMGATVIFSLMIPAMAGNDTVTHEANTGAAILLALYAISIVLLMSLNLNLSNDVLEKGHDFEGTLIKFATIGQLIFGAFVAMVVLFYFSGLPNPDEIALVVSLLVAFVVSAEILSIISWLIAGLRLGMLKEGFRFSRLPGQTESTN